MKKDSKSSKKDQSFEGRTKHKSKNKKKDLGGGAQMLIISVHTAINAEIVRGLGGGKYSPPKAGCALNGFKSFFDFVDSCGL